MDINECCNIAKAATKIGSRCIQNVGPNNIIDTSGRDVKHLADVESERAIVNFLTNSTEYPVLSEECGEHGEINPNGYLWIVDPLDGTLNFTQEIKFTCISIALWRKQKPIVGVIYDFNHEELFAGIVGQGAWCNDHQIFSSGVNNPDKAVLATGFPVNRDFSSDSIAGFLKRIQYYKKIRLLGSAALSLAYVACGRCDAYYEEDIMIWDVAAGIALVKAAGGLVFYQNNRNKKWALTVRAGASFKNKGEGL